MKTALAAVFLLAGAAWAQADRPDEASMFGAPAPAPQASFSVESTDGGGQPLAAPEPPSRDVQELSNPNVSRDVISSGETVENPLTIGGSFYQRGTMSARLWQPFNTNTLSLPLQVNTFLDARPNERIRAYVVGRLQYDPTLDGCSSPTTSTIQNSTSPCPRYAGSGNSGSGGGSQQTQSTSASTSLPGFGGSPFPNNPSVVLDQAWLKFDIEHTVFVTVGKQHVKWGASRFWNPTDFLHTQRRDPTLPYDLRLGNNLAKFEIPVEKWQTNFYAVALFDNPYPSSTPYYVGGAFRAEKVFGNAEAGAEVVFRPGPVSQIGSVPKSVPLYHTVLGADISAPVGPFDVYAEASYREYPDLPIPQFQSGLDQILEPVLMSVPPYKLASPGNYVQVSGGFNYQFGYMENRLATIGVEYFYNSLGINHPEYYPVFILGNAFQPFYNARHYAALFATIEGPDQFKHTNYTVSNIGNLSDGSFISRVDFSWRILTYLTFEAYADYHYGTPGGEFRFAFNGPALANARPDLVPPPNYFYLVTLTTPPPTYDVGFGLRVSI